MESLQFALTVSLYATVLIGILYPFAGAALKVYDCARKVWQSPMPATALVPVPVAIATLEELASELNSEPEPAPEPVAIAPIPPILLQHNVVPFTRKVPNHPATPLTRRELLAECKRRNKLGLPVPKGYSKLKTDVLRQALMTSA